MRGTLRRGWHQVQAWRIIPAHAGNAFRLFRQKRPPPDHPRACGERPSVASPSSDQNGSSPRMRGTHRGGQRQRAVHRIIPAHAGNAVSNPEWHVVLPDHPRACGERARNGSQEFLWPGSSPRMRGTLCPQPRRWRATRIIPAHAGNATPYLPTNAQVPDHPRACGERARWREGCGYCCGSSPRMRGTLHRPMIPPGTVRIIPAHAGNARVVDPLLRQLADHPRACGERLS